jgi:hypothetical protein
MLHTSALRLLAKYRVFSSIIKNVLTGKRIEKGIQIERIDCDDSKRKSLQSEKKKKI